MGFFFFFFKTEFCDLRRTIVCCRYLEGYHCVQHHFGNDKTGPPADSVCAQLHVVRICIRLSRRPLLIRRLDLGHVETRNVEKTIYLIVYTFTVDIAI